MLVIDNTLYYCLPFDPVNHTMPDCQGNPLVFVCVLHIKPIFLPMDTQNTPVRVLILQPREMQALWPQNYDTSEIPQCVMQRGDNTKAMQCNHSVTAVTTTALLTVKVNVTVTTPHKSRS